MAASSHKFAKRLQKELADLRKSKEFRVSPENDDLREWLFVIQGAPDTPYEGGRYMGRIKFGEKWPVKPPVLCLITPSGRFEPNVPLCINGISHYHPENYSSTMKIESILASLVSYMADDGVKDGTGMGIMEASADERRKFAANTHSWNSANATYRKAFPSE